jgi:hypothetical protein
MIRRHLMTLKALKSQYMDIYVRKVEIDTSVGQAALGFSTPDQHPYGDPMCFPGKNGHALSVLLVS